MTTEKTPLIVLATRSTIANGFIGTLLGAEGLESAEVKSPEEFRRTLEDAGDGEAARQKVLVVDVELFGREPLEASLPSWMGVLEEDPEVRVVMC